jgi:hypothetical protein
LSFAEAPPVLRAVPRPSGDLTFRNVLYEGHHLRRVSVGSCRLTVVGDTHYRAASQPVLSFRPGGL